MSENFNNRLTEQEIEDTRNILGIEGNFPGSGVLKSFYYTDICDRLSRGEGVYTIGSWLKDQEQKGPIKDCYITPLTLKKFKDNWFDPLKQKAKDAIAQNEYREIMLGGIKFEKDLVMLGSEKAVVKAENKIIENEQNKIIDGRAELWDMLEDVKKQIRDDNPRNKLKWFQERRKLVESYLRFLGDAASSPQIHMDLLQHEISIFVEATVKTLQKLCPEVMEQFVEEFDNEYKKLSIMKGSILNKEDGEETVNQVSDEEDMEDIIEDIND